MAIPLSYNLRNLLVRRTSTLAAAVGIGLVVAVFVLVLALASGFAHAVRSTGSELNAIVMRKASNAENASVIEREMAQAIAVRPEIQKDEKGQPVVVPELVTLVVLERRTDNAPANVVVRGTGENVLAVRPDIHIVEGGRMFRPGLREVVVGRAISKRMKNLGLGDTLSLVKQEWKVVGIFDASGTGFESEIWGDADVMQAAFRREGEYQSITFRMADPSKFAALEASVESDPKFEAEVKTEAQYYSEQAGMLTTIIGILGTLVTIIMSVGAVFGAMNTMYAAVGSRAREIATLRALGFSRTSVLGSFLSESLVLAVLGGVLGALFSLPVNGITTGTMNWDTFSELTFAFRVTPAILGAGFVFALVMGMVGGLLPAVRAARIPITVGLRQV